MRRIKVVLAVASMAVLSMTFAAVPAMAMDNHKNNGDDRRDVDGVRINDNDLHELAGFDNDLRHAEDFLVGEDLDDLLAADDFAISPFLSEDEIFDLDNVDFFHHF